jgi:hypothetical protein
MSTGELWPTYTAPGCLPELQAKDMRALRRLSREGRSGAHWMGVLMFARDDPARGLTRSDMARAIERSEREVVEIIEEHGTAHIRCLANGAAERRRRLG